MTKYIIILTIGVSAVIAPILWQAPDRLDPLSFHKAMQAADQPLLLDVRTPDEFARGHVPGALNIDWYSPDFKQRITELDTYAPVFIYCNVGRRSFAAADWLRSSGFESVTELNGGIIKWRAAGLPETPAELLLPADVSMTAFDGILAGEHLVLVDLYTPWEANCREMEPVVDELAIAYKGGVKVARINVDIQKHLAAELGFKKLPVIQLFENGKLMFTWEGVTRRAAIDRQLSHYIYSAVFDDVKVALAGYR